MFLWFLVYVGIFADVSLAFLALRMFLWHYTLSSFAGVSLASTQCCGSESTWIRTHFGKPGPLQSQKPDQEPPLKIFPGLEKYEPPERSKVP
jgi:hypothetical protein